MENTSNQSFGYSYRVVIQTQLNVAELGNNIRLSKHFLEI